MSDHFAEELSLLIRAKYPLIYVVSAEEERAEKVIARVAIACQPRREVFYYDLVHGFTHNEQAKNNLSQALAIVEEAEAQLPAIYIFRDLHRRLSAQRTDETIVRQLRNLFRSLRTTRKTIILLSPSLEIPPELEEQIIILNFPLPSIDEIKLVIKATIPQSQLRLGDHSIDQLVKACMGLTQDRILHTLARSLVKRQYINELDIDAVLKEKQQRIRQTEFLEFISPHETIDNIGGLDNLKQWLIQRQNRIS